MTDETPDPGEYLEGDHDWSQLEYLANNGGSVDGAPESGFESGTLTQEMIARRLMWDVSPCSLAIDGSVGRVLGLPATSEDVEDMEHRQSHARLEGISDIAPFIYTFALHATRGVVAATFLASGYDKDADSPEFIDAVDKMQDAIFQSAFSVVAELVDLGVLAPSTVVVSPEEYQQIMSEMEQMEGGNDGE